jgi:hypothetical protein
MRRRSAAHVLSRLDRHDSHTTIAEQACRNSRARTNVRGHEVGGRPEMLQDRVDGIHGIRRAVPHVVVGSIVESRDGIQTRSPVS